MSASGTSLAFLLRVADPRGRSRASGRPPRSCMALPLAPATPPPSPGVIRPRLVDQHITERDEGVARGLSRPGEREANLHGKKTAGVTSVPFRVYVRPSSADASRRFPTAQFGSDLFPPQINAVGRSLPRSSSSASVRPKVVSCIVSSPTMAVIGSGGMLVAPAHRAAPTCAAGPSHFNSSTLRPTNTWQLGPSSPVAERSGPGRFGGRLVRPTAGWAQDMVIAGAPRFFSSASRTLEGGEVRVSSPTRPWSPGEPPCTRQRPRPATASGARRSPPTRAGAARTPPARPARPSSAPAARYGAMRRAPAPPVSSPRSGVELVHASVAAQCQNEQSAVSESRAESVSDGDE